MMNSVLAVWNTDLILNYNFLSTLRLFILLIYSNLYNLTLVVYTISQI